MSVNKQASVYYQRLDGGDFGGFPNGKLPSEVWEGFPLKNNSFKPLITAKTSRFLEESTQNTQSSIKTFKNCKKIFRKRYEMDNKESFPMEFQGAAPGNGIIYISSDEHDAMDCQSLCSMTDVLSFSDDEDHPDGQVCRKAVNRADFRPWSQYKTRYNASSYSMTVLAA